MHNIYDLESLYRVKRRDPNFDHSFCCHDLSECAEDDDWHQPHVPEEWIASFQQSLLDDPEGRDLWKKAMDLGFDAGGIIDLVWLGVGDSFAEHSSQASHSQARHLKKFLETTKKAVSKVKTDLSEVLARRDVALVVGSADWPPEMDEFVMSLSEMLRRVDRLIEHYKPMAHASQNLDTHECFMLSVQGFRTSFQLRDPEIATLLSAGYAESGREPIDRLQVRERMKSVQKQMKKQSAAAVID